MLAFIPPNATWVATGGDYADESVTFRGRIKAAEAADYKYAFHPFGQLLGGTSASVMKK
jgi:hypothetical protein